MKLLVRRIRGSRRRVIVDVRQLDGLAYGRKVRVRAGRIRRRVRQRARVHLPLCASSTWPELVAYEQGGRFFDVECYS